ncbi:MAG: Asp23/Gls24 family envelope stress response protein [Candidatus Bipolaricaulia bacterium]
MGEGRFAGRVEIAEEVIRTIVALAAMEVEGLAGTISSPLNRDRGVVAELEEDGVKITLRVAARYGYPLRELGRKVQEKVKQEVEELTGLKVRAVDVHIQRLQFRQQGS